MAIIKYCSFCSSVGNTKRTFLSAKGLRGRDASEVVPQARTGGKMQRPRRGGQGDCAASCSTHFLHSPSQGVVTFKMSSMLHLENPQHPVASLSNSWLPDP